MTRPARRSIVSGEARGTPARRLAVHLFNFSERSNPCRVSAPKGLGSGFGYAKLPRILAGRHKQGFGRWCHPHNILNHIRKVRFPDRRASGSLVCVINHRETDIRDGLERLRSGSSATR